MLNSATMLTVLSQGATGTQACSPLLHAHVIREDDAPERKCESSARSTAILQQGTRDLGSRAIRRQETRSGQGALARRHTDGPLRAALLKTTAMCKAWRLMHYARPPPDPSRTLFQQLISFSHYNSVLDTDTGTGPIPSITVSGVNAYSGGVLARALPEGLRYLST